MGELRILDPLQLLLLFGGYLELWQGLRPLKLLLIITLTLVPLTEALAKKASDDLSGDPLATISLPLTTATCLSTDFTVRPGSYIAAKPDALAFVGSQGRIRGAYFEQALRLFREGSDMAGISDARFAEAVAAIE